MGLYEESAQISLLLSRPQMPKEKPLAEISAHIFFPPAVYRVSSRMPVRPCIFDLTG